MDKTLNLLDRTRNISQNLLDKIKAADEKRRERIRRKEEMEFEARMMDISLGGSFVDGECIARIQEMNPHIWGGKNTSLVLEEKENEYI